jgi:predicted ester cyclase
MQPTKGSTWVSLRPANRVNFRGISIYRIEGGQIAESWGVSDLLGMMQQLGAIREPGQDQGA